MIQCYGRVDSHRYLVGDTGGKLFMLYLRCEEKMSELPEEIVTDLKLQLLGEVCVCVYVCLCACVCVCACIYYCGFVERQYVAYIVGVPYIRD